MNGHRYIVEFTLHLGDASLDTLRNFLAELGSNLVIEEDREPGEQGKVLKIKIDTDDPHMVFDTSAQFGRIKQVKIEEIK
jgi:dihydroxyacetone kinase-like predicted kinase